MQNTPADPMVNEAGATVTCYLKIADGDGRFDYLVPPGPPNIPSHFTSPRHYGPGDFYVRPTQITIHYGRDISAPGWEVDGLTFDGFWMKDGRPLSALAHTSGPLVCTRGAHHDDPGVNDAVRGLVARYFPAADPFARNRSEGV